MFRLLELIKDCQYFVASEIDEWALIMRVIDDLALADIIEGACSSARWRKWEQEFRTKWEVWDFG